MKQLFPLMAAIMFIMSCSSPVKEEKKIDTKSQPEEIEEEILDMTNTALATFGNGCFWCTEAIFMNLKGVKRVVPGYTGGFIKNPSYKEVCNGTTGHAEAVQIIYDTTEIDYELLLEVFFETHDPTTLNRQGNDVGTQYRSEIFYHDAEQKELAEKAIIAGNESGAWTDTIVTKVSEIDVFYDAEDYHKNYFNRVGEENTYCTLVIVPKIEKFKKKFRENLK